MKKVKLFEGLGRDVESSVNSFVVGKKVIDIKFTTVCYPTQYVSGVPSKMSISDRVLIIYEELEEADE